MGFAVEITSGTDERSEGPLGRSRPHSKLNINTCVRSGERIWEEALTNETLLPQKRTFAARGLTSSDLVARNLSFAEADLRKFTKQ